MSSTYNQTRRRFSSRTQSEDDRLDFDYSIKAILLGDLGVGKTTFLHTFLEHDFGYRTTTSVPRGRVEGRGRAGGDTDHSHGYKILMHQDKRVKLTIWDTAGQERYRSLTASYYRGAQACIIMYNVNNLESFDNVINWLESTNEYLDESSGGAVILLVGVNTGQVLPGRSHEIGDGTAIPTTPTTPNPATPTTTFPTFSRVPAAAAVAVDQRRAENLASHYQVPHIRLDSPRSPPGVAAVVDVVLTQVITRAVGNANLSHTIRPYSVRLSQLAGKRSHCSSCCSA